jgi:cytochrome P450
VSSDATAPARCPHRPDFDPLVAPYLEDPFAVLETLNGGERPIFYSPVLDYYVVTGFAEIDTVFTDPDTFSAANAQAPLVPLIPEAAKILLDGGHRPRPSMVSLDPPEHARLRKPSTRAFTAKRVNSMAGLVRATAGELLDAVADVSPFDLVATLAFPLPANIIFALMGVPPQDYPQLREWCGHRAALSWGRPRPDEQVDIATNIVAYRRYLLRLVESKVDDRADDFTSDLLAIYDEDPDQLRLEEIASILCSLSFAGHETTNYLIGNTVRRLLEDPARWERVVAESEGLLTHGFEQRRTGLDGIRRSGGDDEQSGRGRRFRIGQNLGMADRATQVGGVRHQCQCHDRKQQNGYQSGV